MYDTLLSLKFIFANAATLKYSNDALRRLIGPMGALKRKMEEETGQFNTEASWNVLLTIFYSLVGLPINVLFLERPFLYSTIIK